MAEINSVTLLTGSAAKHFDLIGGKAANLGRLMSIGMPVPACFCVTTRAFTQYLEHNGFLESIPAILSDVGDTPSSGMKEDAARAREMLLAGEFPEDLYAGVLSAHKHLQGKSPVWSAVSVRSSAVVEDASSSSYAGQFSSYLNIRGLEPLLQAIRKCWASVLNDRVLAYRASKGLVPLELDMAVIVQKMVNAVKSGVIFTVHPVTGDTEKVVIEASWGLGESIVSGAIIPDTYVADKGTRKLVEVRIGTKRSMVVPLEAPENGTVSVAVPDDRAQEQCLHEGEIERLLKHALEIERSFGTPQDIEWAIADHNVYILQARPVTA